MRKPVIDQNLTKKIKIDQIANVASRLKMQFTTKKDGECDHKSANIQIIADL